MHKYGWAAELGSMRETTDSSWLESGFLSVDAGLTQATRPTTQTDKCKHYSSPWHWWRDFDPLYTLLQTTVSHPTVFLMGFFFFGTLENTVSALCTPPEKLPQSGTTGHQSHMLPLFQLS